LNAGQAVTMSLSRGARDIKYAIARGHANTAVELDNLRFGGEPTVVTDGLGAYSVGDLEDGTYQLEVVPRNGWTVNTSAPAAGPVTVAGGEVSGVTDWGVIPPEGTSYWQHPSDADDVDDSGDVSLADFESVVKALEVYGIRSAPAGAIAPYLDTDGDGRLTLRDAAGVMRRLLLGPSGGVPAPLGPTVEDRVPASPAEEPVSIPAPAAADNAPGKTALGEGMLGIDPGPPDGFWRALGPVHHESGEACLLHLNLEHLDLFRISDFDIRISKTQSHITEHGFERVVRDTARPVGASTDSSADDLRFAWDEIVSEFAADVLSAWRPTVRDGVRELWR
jgi:hypothetical protein